MATLIVSMVFALMACHDAAAQFHSARGFQLAFKVGASSYTGDLGPVRPGQQRFDLTYEAEAFYRFSQWFGMGFRNSTGVYPGIQTATQRRTSVAINARSYFSDGRFAPYLQAGLSRSGGGAGIGYGVSAAVGIEISISRRFALFQDFSLDSVSPDDVLDGVAGGRGFDTIGRLGMGVRVSFGRSSKGAKFVEIRTPDSLRVGEVGTFQTVARRIGAGSIMYEWEFPGGKKATANPVQQSFDFPGTYEAIVTVHAGEKPVRQWFTFEVFPRLKEEVAEADQSGFTPLSAAPRIDDIAGTTELEVGEQGIYSVVIAPDNDKPVSYLWNMGDGTWLEGNHVLHGYQSPGTYQIQATVENVFGLDNRAMEVTVKTATPEAAVADYAAANVAEADVVVPNEEIRVAVETAADAAPDTTASYQEPEPAVEATDPPAPVVPVAEEREESPPPVREPEIENVVATVITPVPLEPEDANRVGRRQNFPIDWSIGGYTWVTSSHRSRDAADQAMDEFAPLGYPIGVYRDNSGGRTEYHVVVGQFETRAVAERVGPRIQLHGARRLWLLKLP